MSHNQEKRDARKLYKMLLKEHPVSIRLARTMEVGAAHGDARYSISHWPNGAHIEVEQDGAVVFHCEGQRWRARIERIADKAKEAV